MFDLEGSPCFTEPSLTTGPAPLSPLSRNPPKYWHSPRYSFSVLQ